MIQTFLLSSLSPPGEGVMGPTGQARAPDGWDSMFADALMNFLLDQDGENLESLAGAANVLPQGMPLSLDTAFPVIETSGEAAAPAAGAPGASPEVSAANSAAPVLVPPAGSDSPAGSASLTGSALPTGSESPAPVTAAAVPGVTDEATVASTGAGKQAEATTAPAVQPVSEPVAPQPDGGAREAVPAPSSNATEGTDAPVEPAAQPKATQRVSTEELAQPDAAKQAPEQAVEALVKERAASPPVQTVEPAPPAAPDLPVEGPAPRAEVVVEQAAPSAVQPLPSPPESPVVSQPTVQAVEGKDQDVLMQMVRTIQSSVQHGQSSLRLQLHPQELGSIDVRLVSNPQGVGVTVFADQASTGRLLEMQIDQLRVALQDAGVQISHLNVFQQNQQRHEAPADWNRKPYSRRQPAFAGQDSPAVDAVDEPRLGHSMVDYRV